MVIAFKNEDELPVEDLLDVKTAFIYGLILGGTVLFSLIAISGLFALGSYYVISHAGIYTVEYFALWLYCYPPSAIIVFITLLLSL